MADPRVQFYLFIAGEWVCNKTPNTSIVDVAAEDYVSTLTPIEREDAEIEVNIMAGSTEGPDWERRLLLVRYLKELRVRGRTLEARIAVLEAQGQGL
jgi:hypothetical protein